MKTKRIDFLNVLNTVICGTHKTEILEQSNCFIFDEGTITAFNGEILASSKYDGDLGNFAVPAHDLINVISKIPDEVIKIEKEKNKLLITGKKKRSGIFIQNEVILPISELTIPKKMGKIKEGIIESLKMASKICSPNNEDYRISHIQVSPNRIQATDKLRFLRISIETGIKNTTLIPASALLSIPNINIDKIKTEKGWLWIGNKNVKIGICCTEDEYLDDKTLDNIINVEDGNQIQLPSEMEKVIDRAMVMSKEEATRLSKVKITKKSITVRTEKETGWYEERQPVKYKGQDLELIVGLGLFKELLRKTKKAYVNKNKMKMKKDNIEFLVCLGE